MGHVLALARHASRRCAPLGSLALALCLAGLASGSLIVMAAVLLDTSMTAADEALGTDGDPGATCAWLPVGSPHQGYTQVHLLNSGPHPASIRVTWSDQYGVDRPPQFSDRVALAGWASTDIGFNTPALGAFIELASSVPHFQASADLHPLDGTATEHRRAHPCLSP